MVIKTFLHSISLPKIYGAYQNLCNYLNWQISNIFIIVATSRAPNIIEKRKPWTLSIVMSQRVCCYYNIVKCYFATFKNCPIMWENRHMQTLCKISISLFPFAKQKGTYKFFSHHHHHAPSVLGFISYAKMVSFGFESKIYFYVTLKTTRLFKIL